MKRTLHILLGALAMLVGLELVMQVLPVSTSTSTGYYIHPHFMTSPPRHRWTMATGWDLRNVQSMRSNNFGFAAEHDFVAGSNAIALIGDSYVEASMLPMADRPAAQLERALGGQRPVYAMGDPGSSLLGYGVRIRWAYETLGLRDFVVQMESTDASQVLCNSGNVHSRCLDPQSLAPSLWHQPPAGPLKSLLRESALAQYLVSQLKFSPGRLVSRNFWHAGAPVATVEASHEEKPASGDPPSPSVRTLAVIDKAVSVFRDDLKGLDGLRIVFVIDMNRHNLGTGIPQPDEGYHVAQLLRNYGYAVVQGEPLYREHLRHSPLHLEMGPHDRHLNAIGVGLLMAEAAKAFKAQENQRIN